MDGHAVPVLLHTITRQKSWGDSLIDPCVFLKSYPSVAQSGRASALGAEGREFESLHSDIEVLRTLYSS